MEKQGDALVVGAGLAGLSCAHALAAEGRRVRVVEAHPYAGGRTSSFIDEGMPVESGLHRYIGYYAALPRLLGRCGILLSDIVTWEEKADILVKGEGTKVTLGLAPVHGPVKTLRGLVGNGDCLTPKDKASLLPFFVRGMVSYAFSTRLDELSVAEYARRCGVSARAQRLILEPLSSGIFFMPPEHYSAYAFFGLFAPAIPKFYAMRIGAFLGGMTEVMCDPIVRRIEELGGEFHFGEKAQRVTLEEGRVTGVQTAGGQVYRARQTVIATTLPAAREILSPLQDRRELETLFALPCMSACTLQLELDGPALEKDITTFGPGTDMVSFAEQSRTTFRRSEGRLSVILGHPEKYAQKSAEEILPAVLAQMEELGVHLRGRVKACRKVAEGNDFYSLDAGSQRLRPAQRTGIPGLTLAGDYTKTRSFATMEGAVLSGEAAAKACLRALAAEGRRVSAGGTLRLEQP